MILAHANIIAWVHLRPPLADNDVARNNRFATKLFHA
jgi:hypothetical protein